MKLRFACIAAVLAAAACSPAPDSDGAEAPAAKRMPLPDCAEVKAQDAGDEGWKHPDCRAMFPDQSGLAIEARYTPAEDDSTKITVQVVQAGDATVQTFEERMGNTFNSPTLADVDKDGLIDIQVPLETGNVNTTWAIWKQVAGPKFVRIGEPTGVEIAQTESGYLAAQGRSSAVESYVTFYKLVGEDLQEVVTARVVGQGEPGSVTAECSLEEEAPGLAALGLTTEAARAQFCAEPMVNALVKDMAGTP